MASSSSSSKIHLYKKSAIEDGTPEDYYLDPSDNLMKITSSWSVVEHEDHLVLTVKLLDIGKLVAVGLHEDAIDILVLEENKEKAARFHHKDGMDNFSIKLNQKFLKCVKGDGSYRGLPDASVMLFIKKLKLENESSAGRISDLDSPVPESIAKQFMNKLKLKNESSEGIISDLDVPVTERIFNLFNDKFKLKNQSDSPVPDSIAKQFMIKFKLKNESSAGRLSDLDSPGLESSAKQQTQVEDGITSSKNL